MRTETVVELVGAEREANEREGLPVVGVVTKDNGSFGYEVTIEGSGVHFVGKDDVRVLSGSLLSYAGVCRIAGTRR